ncbi:MAG: tetratricopeptide repeat protein, partial [Pseudomonadota bacterium]
MSNDKETMGSVREAFDAATTLLKHGQVTTAEVQLREILKVAPDEVNSLRLLGDLLISHKGDTTEGLSLLERTVQLAPGFGQGVVSLVRARLRMQQSSAVVTLLDELLSTSDQPLVQSSELWQLYGDALFETERDEDARIAQQRSIDLDPFKDAMQRAIRASMSGHPRETESVYREILKANPDHVHALVGLANIALDRNVSADAERLLDHADEISPNMSPVHRGFARLHMSQSRFPEARAAAERATRLNPEIADNWTSLGTVLAWGLQQDAAVAAFNRSLAINQKQPRVYLSLGHVLKALGDQPGSEHAYHQSIDANPTLGEAWWSLADLKTYRFTDTELEEMQQLIGASRLHERDLSALHFALGKAWEDRREANRSFHHYQEGNRIRHQFESFNADRFKEQCTELKRVFSTPMMERRRSTNNDTHPVPIFVVGLPRSGSTLVDQILSSHSQVQGTMELPHILGYVREMQRDADDEGYPGHLMSMSRHDLEMLGARYLDETAAYHHNAPFFVDKMPNN